MRATPDTEFCRRRFRDGDVTLAAAAASTHAMKGE